MSAKPKIAVLTGGGDTPGLNAAVKAVVYDADYQGFGPVLGIYDGWHGLLDGFCDETMHLERLIVRTWEREGGTHLGSSRTNPFKFKDKNGKIIDRSKEVLANIEKLGLDCVVAIGGEDTLGVANKLYALGANVIGIPKTIDKDLNATDYSLGFDTGLKNCMEQIEKVRNPAGSHHWVEVVEVMGRHAGHLALWSGVAADAYMILIPEHPFSYKHLKELLDKRLSLGTKDRKYPRYAIVVVAEGAAAAGGELVIYEKGLDSFGHVKLGGIGEVISKWVRDNTEYESRSVILGHPQRGGAPTSLDRIMAMMFGSAAIEAYKMRRFGMMVSAEGVGPTAKIHLVKLADAVSSLRLVDVEKYYDTNTYNIKRQFLV